MASASASASAAASPSRARGEGAERATAQQHRAGWRGAPHHCAAPTVRDAPCVRCVRRVRRVGWVGCGAHAHDGRGEQVGVEYRAPHAAPLQPRDEVLTTRVAQADGDEVNGAPRVRAQPVHRCRGHTAAGKGGVGAELGRCELVCEQSARAHQRPCQTPHSQARRGRFRRAREPTASTAACVRASATRAS